MEETQFASFKYQHAGRAGISDKRRKWLIAATLLSVIGGLVFFPGGLALLVVPLLIFFSAPKRLLLGPRYLICGTDIIFYGNVDTLTLDRNSGRLTLASGAGKPFVVEREKFPTNARKTPKVAANKAAKFAKVAEKLIEKVQRASPAVELSGVSGS